MANSSAAFGFRSVRRIDGSGPNFAMTIRQIASTNTTAIGFGDPVTSLNTGYITRSTAGTTIIAGIFTGCEYLSSALGRKVWLNYWPGSGAAADADGQIINDPKAVFQVRGSGTAITLADVGINANFILGTVNTSTGIPATYLDQTTLATTNTLPFRVIGLSTDPTNDNTSSYNIVEVTFNNQDFNQTTGV